MIKFDFAYGLDRRLEHIPTDDISEQGIMKIIAAYALRQTEEDIKSKVMFKQIDLVLALSQTKFWPVETHYESGKIVIQRLFKYLPINQKFNKR